MTREEQIRHLTNTADWAMHLTAYGTFDAFWDRIEIARRSRLWAEHLKAREIPLDYENDPPIC